MSSQSVMKESYSVHNNNFHKRALTLFYTDWKYFIIIIFYIFFYLSIIIFVRYSFVDFFSGDFFLDSNFHEDYDAFNVKLNIQSVILKLIDWTWFIKHSNICFFFLHFLVNVFLCFYIITRVVHVVHVVESKFDFVLLVYLLHIIYRRTKLKHRAIFIW